ncbi:hypothetical protein FOCC_FOCC005565, partial [Frankliniella occidentalis]
MFLPRPSVQCVTKRRYLESRRRMPATGHVMRFLQCPRCKKEYDKAQHFPKLLIPCGHPVCLRCVPRPTTRNWECPTCK